MTHDQTTVRSPQAVRLQRPGWRDPRLLLGILLVGGSVALGSGLVAAAGRTVPVYAADGPLVAGETVDAGRLEIRQVRLPDGADAYLSAAVPLASGLVAVRTVGDGELVPLSALGRGADLDLRPVAVTPAVDLWYVPAADPGGGSTAASPEAPTQLAASLTVAEVSEPDGAFSVGQGITVQVLVPVDQLAPVLAALASKGSVELVHVPGGAEGS
jgi:hypothetical protein